MMPQMVKYLKKNSKSLWYGIGENKNVELCRYNLTDDYANMTAMLFGEIYRNGNSMQLVKLQIDIYNLIKFS